MKLIYKFTAYPEAGETLLGTFKLSCINVCIDPNREDQTCIILFFFPKADYVCVSVQEGQLWQLLYYKWVGPFTL